MRQSHFGLGAAASLAILMTGLPRSVAACSCYAVAGKMALPAAVTMFTGKAARVQFLEADTQRNEPAILVTFEVHDVWKGPVRKALRLRTTYNRWTCGGYYFKEGETYLVTAYQLKVLADQQGVELGGVNPCGATRELKRAADVVRDLGPGQKPAEAAGEEAP